MDHDDGVRGVIIANEELVIRRFGKLIGGLPSYIQAEIQKDKTNSSVRSEMGFTTGKGILPLSVGGLETTHLNVYLSCTYMNDHATINDTNYTFRLESSTENLLLNQNKLILGLLMSSEHPLELNGPLI